MHDLVCDVIIYWDLSCEMGKIGVNDNALIKNVKEKRWDRRITNASEEQLQVVHDVAS